MGTRYDGKKEVIRHVQSLRKMQKKLVDENHGPKCGCDGCFTFLYNRQAHKYLPGSYLLNYWQDKEQRHILPN